MTIPPAEIDGAKVIEYAWSDEPFGVVADSNGENPIYIHGLAICRYDDTSIVYRFSCNKKWETEQDMDYGSVEEAKDQLPNAPIEWSEL